jgi:hypothetical protein
MPKRGRLPRKVRVARAFHDRLVREGSWATEPDPERANLCDLGHRMRLEKIVFTRTCTTWALVCGLCNIARIPIQLRPSPPDYSTT